MALKCGVLQDPSFRALSGRLNFTVHVISSVQILSLAGAQGIAVGVQDEPQATPQVPVPEIALISVSVGNRCAHTVVLTVGPMRYPLMGCGTCR